MKFLIYLFFTFGFSILFFSQESNNIVTSKKIDQLKVDIEKEIGKLRENLVDQDLSAQQIEFAIDTFRIEELAARRMEIDASNFGLIQAINELNNSYDDLINKYYKKLLGILNSSDKQLLINAQRSWLVYRDNEFKLMAKMQSKIYEGSSIQNVMLAGEKADLVSRRAINLFHYYNDIVKTP